MIRGSTQLQAKKALKATKKKTPAPLLPWQSDGAETVVVWGNKEKDDKEKDEEKEKEKETDWTPKLAVVALFFTLWWTNIAIENGHL